MFFDSSNYVTSTSLVQATTRPTVNEFDRCFTKRKTQSNTVVYFLLPK